MAGELECGQLTSSSDSEEDNSSEDADGEAGEMLGEEQSLGDGENDVDDETMSGDNDVEYCHSLTQIDSLTEHSLESLGKEIRPIVDIVLSIIVWYFVSGGRRQAASEPGRQQHSSVGFGRNELLQQPRDRRLESRCQLLRGSGVHGSDRG